MEMGNLLRLTGAVPTFAYDLYNVRHAARKVFFHLLSLLSNNTLHYFRLTPRPFSSKKSSRNHASTRAKTSRVSCHHFLYSELSFPAPPKARKPRIILKANILDN